MRIILQEKNTAIFLSKGYTNKIICLNFTYIIYHCIRWLPGIEKPQFTDTHYDSLNGEGLFNWRFKFLFSYSKTENVIIYKVKSAFSLDYEEQRVLPKLHLQIWDKDKLSSDDYIGKFIHFVLK